MYFVVTPQTLWSPSPHFGEWKAATKEGQYITFETIPEAQEFGKTLGGEFYVLQLVG